MKFGAMIQPNIDDPSLPSDIERLGFDSLWVPDSHMIASDCYAVLAQAARNTSRLRLGTGVSIAGARIAPVAAHSIATVNRLAPGRTFIGVGTGHTAMRVMGHDPIPPTEFREYLRVLRGLLREGEVDFTWRGRTRTVKFLHRQLGLVDIDHPIPILVAANGPKAIAAAGAFGDGRITAENEDPAQMRLSQAAVRAGAAAVGRSLPASFEYSTLAFACVLRPGETLRSERVIEQVGPMATAYLHYWYEWYLKTGSDAGVPTEIELEWRGYLERVEKMKRPPELRYLDIHEGHCTYLLPEERHLVTPNLVRAARGFVGEPDEILAMLREREAAGLSEVAILPPIACAREVYRDFAEQVIAKY